MLYTYSGPVLPQLPDINGQQRASEPFRAALLTCTRMKEAYTCRVGSFLVNEHCDTEPHTQTPHETTSTGPATDGSYTACYLEHQYSVPQHALGILLTCPAFQKSAQPIAAATCRATARSERMAVAVTPTIRSSTRQSHLWRPH